MKFNPWDIPTDEFADRIEAGPTIQWKENEWQVLLIRTRIASQKRLALRQLNCTGVPPLWWVGRATPFFPFFLSLSYLWSAKKTELSPEELVLNALEEGQVALWYHTDSNCNLRSRGETATRRFSLNAHNQGMSEKMPQYTNPTLFSWSTPVREFANQDSMTWWRILREELADPGSDAFFAVNLGELSPHQQRDAMWKWKNGDYETANEILHAALLSQHDLWDKESWWRWDINFPLSDENRYGSIRSRMEVHETNPLLALQRAAEFINDYFSPHPDEHLAGASFCVRSWQQRYPLRFRVYYEAPTMHERMEATLRWREWQEKRDG